MLLNNNLGIDIRKVRELVCRLYSKICDLSRKEGYCWANNKYLADSCKVSRRTIQRALRALKEEDLIVSSLKDQNERKIFIKKPLTNENKRI